MKMTEYLAAEWKPALGCTEPAAVAWATALASAQGKGVVKGVALVCDPRTYKNCYAVGLPKANRKTGILRALAIGASLPNGDLGLRSFEAIDDTTLMAAEALLTAGAVSVSVDLKRSGLWVDVVVTRENGRGRALLEHEHSRLARLEKDGTLVGGAEATKTATASLALRQQVAALDLSDMIALARSLKPEDRAKLQEGIALNLAIARHGLSLLPAGFVAPMGLDSQTRLSRLVSAGVLARMSGEAMTVMTLAGSGNKGITLSLPVALWARETGHPDAHMEEALAFGCLMTTAVTYHLGTLSAICGAANAAGIGIAAALTLLEGGTPQQVDLAVSNMVGNVAGMICDGAKIGCALKTMTGVDAAFRAAHLALAGVGIPGTDGIVGQDAMSSLANLGRLAQKGMAGVDADILGIMQDKLLFPTARKSAEVS